MSKSLTVQSSQDAAELLRSARGELVPFRQLFDALAETLPHDQGFIATSLSRGSLQIAQPPRVSESLLKNYAREYHAHDRPAWEAIVRRQAIRAEDCWADGELQASRYYTEFLSSVGVRYVIVAPLAEPVIAGYPGVIELMRTEAQGEFTDQEIERLTEIAGLIDDAVRRAHAVRRGESGQSTPLPHVAANRVFAFDSNLRPKVGEETFNALGESLRNSMLDLARQRLGHMNGKPSSGDRVSLPDATGDLWNFRAVAHREYPALGEGPFVFLCLQPECEDWGMLRSADFAADGEVARLVPAVKFMQEEYHRGPTLQEIAKTVHLSPFHFHRRFTELLGITPKHLLLDCQIQQAKRELIARQKELAEIATACGFAHQSHFTSRFKQATGLTPTRWRRLAFDKK